MGSSISSESESYDSLMILLGAKKHTSTLQVNIDQLNIDQGQPHDGFLLKRYKIWICSVILGKLGTFRNYKGFSIIFAKFQR